jgi:hypothetical protein
MPASRDPSVVASAGAMTTRAPTASDGHRSAAAMSKPKLATASTVSPAVMPGAREKDDSRLTTPA